ncbi:hypothetical protein HY489_06210 [Candidatus Woesearchaeota archaeon]|nr:hypothetical protein [Candidatus Woesearchaeota archaeon]
MNELRGMFVLFGGILITVSAIWYFLILLMFPGTTKKAENGFLFWMLCTAWAEVLFIFSAYLIIESGLSTSSRIIGRPTVGIGLAPFLALGAWLSCMIPDIVRYERSSRPVILAKIAAFMVMGPLLFAVILLAIKYILSGI